MKKLLLLSAIFFSYFLVSGWILNDPETKQKEVLPGEIRLSAKAIHPEWRTDAFPSNLESDINPPAFFWPSLRRDYREPLRKYDFELSRDKSFANTEISIKGQEPSFCIAEHPLAKGVWYWQYREQGTKWKGPFTFSIGESSLPDNRPSVNDFVAAIKGERPRILIRKEKMDAFMKQYCNGEALSRFKKSAEVYVGVVLPEIEWGGKFFKNGNRVFVSGKFPEDHDKSQSTAQVFFAAAESLSKAYLFTGDKVYGNEAIRWVKQICSFKLMPGPITYDGNPTPDGFDFAFMLGAVATIYDSEYNLFTEEERTLVRENLAQRLKVYYEYYCNRVENRVLDNHTWQISLKYFLQGALTAKGDIKEADKYLAYAYNIWAAVDPEQSRTDGGWHGGGYVGVNIGVWKSVPAYFRSYTGYNFYQYPFYRNHPQWFFYRQPPGSSEDGFSGDGYEGAGKGIAANLGEWLNILDADLDLPVARWLAGNANQSKKGTKNAYDIAWERATEGMPVTSGKINMAPKDFPQAKAFRDVGVVNMHRNLLNPAIDLFVSLRSGPYGTFGHNLASHNAFTVLYQGEPLFMPYGHRFGGAQHAVLCYRHSRGHNTVLIDGKGQPFSTEAYGWIARFLNGDKIAYACGDASNAYKGEPSIQWRNTFNTSEQKWEDQMANGEMKRFRRHVLFLRPSLVVVYDELEAYKPVSWDWILYCRQKMIFSNGQLKVEGTNAVTDIVSSMPLSIKINEQPLYLPYNVDGRGSSERGTPYDMKGCHAICSSKDKGEKLRILTFIQVGDINPLEETVKGTFKCGQWLISGEMDPGKMANLKISNSDDSASFLLKSADKGETILKENINKRMIIQKAVDELPYHARGLEQVSNIIK
jgi:hypothetical protein